MFYWIWLQQLLVSALDGEFALNNFFASIWRQNRATLSDQNQTTDSNTSLVEIAKTLTALVYFSRPWENIFSLWKYLKIQLLQIANKTSLTKSYLFISPSLSLLNARWHIQKVNRIWPNKFRHRLSALVPLYHVKINNNKKTFVNMHKHFCFFVDV